MITSSPIGLFFQLPLSVYPVEADFLVPAVVEWGGRAGVIGDGGSVFKRVTVLRVDRDPGRPEL